MGGHSHDGACTIGHQYIVGNPDRYLLAVHGIGGGEAVDLHARLFLCQLRQRISVLRAYLAFAALPGMESVIFKGFQRFLISSLAV